MTYDELDILPLKLYIKILNTGDISLLATTKGELKPDNLKELWQRLKQEYNDLGGPTGANKIVDVTTRIEILTTKYDFVIAAANALNFAQDEELENSIRELGYKLRFDSYMLDLERIKKEASGMLMQVKRLESQLDGQPGGKDKGKKQTLDRVIMGYMAVTGVQYDTNAITCTQFFALKDIFDNKLRDIQKQREAMPKAAKLKNNKK